MKGADERMEVEADDVLICEPDHDATSTGTTTVGDVPRADAPPQ
jgi:hypothetical protein